jgi:hypothetical protein
MSSRWLDVSLLCAFCACAGRFVEIEKISGKTRQQENGHLYGVGYECRTMNGERNEQKNVIVCQKGNGEDLNLRTFNLTKFKAEENCKVSGDRAVKFPIHRGRHVIHPNVECFPASTSIAEERVILSFLVFGQQD